MKKFKNLMFKFGALFLCVSILYVSIGNQEIANMVRTIKGENYNSSNFNRVSDSNTMDSYKEILLSDENGSRYAGRIWADKTVVTNDLSLDMDTDGINKTIFSNTDFLNVYSALGSSLTEKTEKPIPVDVVFIIDLSGSMGADVVDQLPHDNHTERLQHSRIYQTVTSVNNAIDYLMNKGEENRISVVVYGASAYTLMDLGHYEKENNQEYITVEDFTDYIEPNYKTSGACAYTLRAHAKKDGEIITRTVRNNYTTGMQEDKINSLDAIIGYHTNLQAGIYQGFNELYRNMQRTSDVTYTYSSGLSDEKVTVPRIPVAIVMSDGGSNYALKDSTKPIAGDEWYNIQMPNIVNDYIGDFTLYRTETNQVNRGGKETILETLLTASFMKAKVQNKYNELISKANIDLSQYSAKFNVITLSVDTPDSKWQVPRVYMTLDPKTYFKKDLPDVDWEFKEDALNAYALYEQWKDSSTGIVSTFMDTSNSLIQLQINKLPEGTDGVTNADIINNINYNDSFDDLNSDEVSNFFGKIISNITETSFTPLSGKNDLGVGNSLTYLDPIGKYMEVKDKAISIDGKDYDMSLLLFGKLHTIRKAAIYNYNFNSTHRGPNHDSNNLSEPFISGWYDKDGKYLDSGGSWENGDKYYADVSQVQKYVPTLSETSAITDKQKATIYTLYSFEDEDADKDLQNPCYDATMTYKLNDIRIWTENTENYVDEDEANISPELGFDMALYVNIPITALPLQVASVEIGNEDSIISYDTNLDNKAESTPIRLFYGIGVDSDIMTEDGLDIDISKVSQEYIKANKINDKVYFYSNYYSATTYNGYVTDSQEERTIGDAAVSFSPETSNRYYLFQKPLPLYEVKETDKSEVGTYKDIPLEDSAKYNVFTSTHSTITTIDKSRSLNSESWYYIIIDYYMPNRSTPMHLAVARQGKEFGSGIANGSVEAGQYLCWYSPSRDTYVNFVIGEDKPTDADDYIIATRPGGLRTGDLAQSLRQKTQNNTKTSKSYYLPIISSTSSSNIVIDTYLGNNGRLEVNDSLMMIAKEVTTNELGEKTIDRNREYNFTLKMNDHEGDYSFIKMYKNPYSNEWQLRLSTIDVLTSNTGFLQDETTNPYVYELNGKKYYIYIGKNEISGDTGGDDVFRVYSAPDNDNYITLTKSGMTTYVNDPSAIEEDLKTNLNKYKKIDATHSLGSIDFWIDKVYLIPTDIVDNGTWNQETDNYQYLNEFVIAHLDSNKKGVEELSSNYSTKTVYLTKSLNFGYTSENKPEEKPNNWTEEEWNNQVEHVAQFTLKDNEGLMLTGLKSGINYELKENITTQDNKDGYYFDRITIGEEDTATITDKTVQGRVNSNYIDEVVYVNRYHAVSNLAIKKEVKGLLGEKDKEWIFDVKLTIPEGIALKDSYNYHYEVIDGITKRADGQLIFESLDNNQYIAHVNIKHGETIVIEDLPEQSGYEVIEREANTNDYITDVSNETGTLTQERHEVTFINSKYEKYNITLTKEIKGEAAEDKEWTFEIELTPKEGIHFSDKYAYTGDITGILNLTKNEENKYVGDIKLDSNQKITIQGLPEDTLYSIREKEANKDGYITLSENNEGILNKQDTNVKFTNIKYSRHKLKVEKIVTGGAGDKEREWTFKITFTPAEDVIFDTSYSYKGGHSANGIADHSDGILDLVNNGNGTYTGIIKLKHGENITIENIPERTKYKVEEIEANTDEYYTMQTLNFEGELSKEEIVRFTNTKLSKHDITISKKVTGAWADKEKEWTFKITLKPLDYVILEKEYRYTGSKEGLINFKYNQDGTYIGEVTLKNNDEITIQGLPQETKYKVEEIEANEEGYTTRVTGTEEGTLTYGKEDPNIAFNNIKLSQHSITVSKEVTGEAGDKEKEWHFIIKLIPDNDVTLLDRYPIIGGNTVSNVTPLSETYLELEHNRDGTSIGYITLRHGESITINNLPEGTTYEVIEEEANKDGYVTWLTGEEKGTLKDKTSFSVKYINKKPSKKNLTLSKEVTGGAGDKEKEWTFEITLTPDDHIALLNEYLYDGDTTGIIAFEKQSDGSSKGSITLKHNQTITIKGLPENTKYSVSEKEANKDGYITIVTGKEQGVLEQDETIKYQNTKLSKHNIKISKKVYGDLGDKDKEWTFKLIFKAPSITSLSPEYSYVLTKTSEEEQEEGTIKIIHKEEYDEATIKLKHNEAIEIKDLPEGTTYEVIEEEANQDGYITMIKGETKGILNGETPIITYNNKKYSKYNLSIEKQLKGNDAEIEKEWTFKVILKPEKDAPFEEFYTYTGKEEGILELTVTDDGLYEGEITLKGGEQIVIKDIPYGTTYEVIEEEANKDGYKTTYEKSHGKVTEEIKVVITNEKNIVVPSTLDQISKYFITFICATITLLVCLELLFKMYNQKER